MLSIQELSVNIYLSMAPQYGWYSILNGWPLSEINCDLFLMVIIWQFVTCYSSQRESKTTSMSPSFPQKLVTAQITESIGESSLEISLDAKKFLGKSSLFDFYGFQLSRVVLGVILFEELPRVSLCAG